ncbi:Hpt domain-containing protein [uncultured Psychrosphaera sp.]|uniref:Hpt domain-containing protein n=1 Tax=uncultured Psychrosphaera sp. TaxID=1403522 RepID=UPI0026132075|nr:Hpt domain-containing protein [uncultured Psychrosphaera sp.]
MKSTKFIDISELEDIFGEMDNSETCETVESLQADFILKLSVLTNCVEQNDISTFKLNAHSLKSNCSYLGATQLNQNSYQLELTTSFKDDNFSSNWATFKNTFDSTMSEIQETIEQLK